METHSGLPNLPLRLGAMQIVGLIDPVEGDWARLRAIQYRDLHRAGVTRTVAQSMAALIVVGLYFGEVATILLAAWLFALSMALAHKLRIERTLTDIDRRLMTRTEFRRHSLAIASVALLWAFPLFAFGLTGSMADLFALWTVTAMLIAACSTIVPQTPIATLLYSGLIAPAAATAFVLRGEYGFAVVAVVVCVLIVAGAVQNARTYLAARIAEAGVAEKDEVVSLLLREFEENEADWLWQVDPNRRIKSASPRFAYALASDPKDLEGKKFVELVAGSRWQSGDCPPSLHELADNLKRRESFSNLLVQVDVAGERRWWELSGTPIIDETGTFAGFRGVGSDVTEQRESDEKIAYLARYDTLTGLPNRLMLTEGLAEALRYADKWMTRCAFLMIDLDRFKAVNDSLGHQIGDRLLAQVSARLKSVMTDNEQVGRLGGDEFAVVIRDSAAKGYVDDLANRVINTLSAPYEVDNHTLYIGASVGSAVGPRDGNTVETVMRNADLALYRAKDAGGGEHHRFMPALHTDAEERRTLETSLRSAIGHARHSSTTLINSVTAASKITRPFSGVAAVGSPCTPRCVQRPQ